MSTVCPLCNSQQPDHFTVCSYCGASLRAGSGLEAAMAPPAIPPPPPVAPPPAVVLAFPKQTPAVLGWSERKLSLSAAFTGLALGVIFSLSVSQLAPKASMLARLFDLHGASGIVPVSITVMFFWGAALCFLRLRRQRALENVAGQSLLLEAVRQLANSGPEALAKYLEKPSFAVSPLLRRLQAVLRQWRLHPGLIEADLVLQEHHAQDDEKVRRGFQITRTFVWAMPVVGLMGTVIGISLAVGGFAQFLSGGVDNLDLVKNSLVGVTKGLSFAFLITLEGLLGALLLMLPATSLQAREEGFLIALQHAIADRFLPELQRAAPSQGLEGTRVEKPAIDVADFEEAFRRALSDVPSLRPWQEQMVRLTDAAVAKIEQRTQEETSSGVQALGRAQGEIAAGLLAIVQRQEQMAQGLTTDLQASHSDTRNLLDEIERRLGSAAGEMAGGFESLNAREAARWEGLIQGLETWSRETSASLSAHQEGFRKAVEQWRAEGPRVESYFTALQQLGQEIGRAVTIQRDIQSQMAALNAQGTLTQALEEIQQTIAGLEPFLRRLTGAFHFVTAPEIAPQAVFGEGR